MHSAFSSNLHPPCPLALMPPRGRRPGTPQPPGFGRLISVRNRERRLASAKKAVRADRSLLSSTFLARRDEERFAGQGEGGGDEGHTRDDKALTSRAVVRAAFTENALAIGLQVKTSVRAQYVAAACLHEFQVERLSERLREGLKFMVWKRSGDETPLNARDTDGSILPTKVLNQRGHIRWGPRPGDASRVILPGLELLGADALALLEGLERPLRGLHYQDLNNFARDMEWCVHVQLGDSLAANKLQFAMVSHLMPDAFHLYQRCDSHQLAIISLRPMDVQNFINPLHAFSKLVRIKQNRLRLTKCMVDLVRTEVADNIFVGVPPDPASASRVRLIQEELLQTVDRWAAATEAADILPRIRQMRKCIAENVDLFTAMFNGLALDRVTHFCLGANGGRCCANNAEVFG